MKEEKIYEVWIDGMYPTTARDILSHDFAEAAKKYCEQYNNEDNQYATHLVCVRRTEKKVFRVSVELTISYTAESIE